MPTNLPDPRERKEESRDKLLRVLLVFVRIALVIAFQGPKFTGCRVSG
jgi:hypothetical protein